MTRHNVEAKGTIITDHSRVYIATFYGVGCGRLAAESLTPGRGTGGKETLSFKTLHGAGPPPTLAQHEITSTVSEQNLQPLRQSGSGVSLTPNSGAPSAARLSSTSPGRRTPSPHAMTEPSSLRSPTSTHNVGAVPVANGTPADRG